MRFAKDVWSAFLRLPRWVQYWGACILVPANLLTICFVGYPGGWLVCALAIGGMIPNAFILIVTREFGREMAISHLIFWLPLLAVIFWILRADPEWNFASFLWILLVVDTISILFDIRETRIWLHVRRTK
ncbi:MAG: hypothetical protein ACR2O1_02680 [Boseongicola sp.]